MEEAFALYALSIPSSGIAIEEGQLVVRLACGERDRVVDGQRFLVVNSANGEIWGVLEAYRVDDDSCLCYVSVRINTEFWEFREERVNSEPSLPDGIAVMREVPDEEEFLGLLRAALDLWRANKR